MFETVKNSEYLTNEELEMIMKSLAETVWSLQDVQKFFNPEGAEIGDTAYEKLCASVKKHKDLAVKITTIFVERTLKDERKNNGTRPAEEEKTSESINDTQ